MIPFDPADIWLWGSSAEAPPAATVSADNRLFIGEVQSMANTMNMASAMAVNPCS